MEKHEGVCGRKEKERGRDMEECTKGKEKKGMEGRDKTERIN